MMTTLPFLSRARTHRPVGFTLVEILSALFVLAIGFSCTLAIIMRSTQMGIAASDRNNASMLIPEAIDEIKKALSVGAIDVTPDGINHTGEFMDTVNLSASDNPFAGISFPNYPNGTVQFRGLKYALQETDAAGRNLNLVFWPLNTRFGRAMGQQSNGPRLLTDLVQRLDNKGNTYRALFKLEPHPDWVPNPYVRDPKSRENYGSAFVGVYVLTLTMYRDLNPNVATDSTTPLKKLQQVADPVVVLLHDSKVRS